MTAEPKPNRLHLDRKRAALLVVDVQERLSAAMPPEAFAAALANMRRLVQGAAVLGVPVLWAEQYVKGLGPTVAPLKEVMPPGAAPVEKLTFSCAASEPLMAQLAGRTQVICLGMESHVCVFQTVRDLEARGLQTFVPADAVISRTKENRDVGLALMHQAGATVTSTETALFDLTERAGTDEFRAISKLVK
jgi:nicotinamidase-related amidase